jgi:hypothetical protein
LYKSYPDDKAEIEGLRKQIEADELGWPPVKRNEGASPCPSNDPLGLFSPEPCEPLQSKKGAAK